MIGENVPDQHKQITAQLSSQIDQFFASGGSIQRLKSFSDKTLPPVRCNKIDPETVLKRRRISPTRAERKTLRKLAEDL
ncbi:MAG TPA: hypothetical protein VGC62_19075 [Pseudomonas sp.]|uniref:hypothetical protein n=1 Tax=Pseudomonas sp. TaxID=306 RepID=UPI002ED91236